METFIKWFSLSRVIFWIGVTACAYFFGWLASVTFVALCSLYANVASDFAAWRADDNPQFDRIEKLLNEILTELKEK